jgi:hypothetical protein
MEPIIHEIISKITSSFNEELEKLVKESRDISSDRGSTPLASTSLAHNRTLFGLAVSVYFFNRLLHWVENRSQSNINKYSHVLPCEQGPL